MVGLLVGVLLAAIYVFFNSEEKSKVKQQFKKKIQEWAEEEPIDLSQNGKLKEEQPVPKPKLYAIFK